MITLQTTSYCNYFCPKCPWHGDNVFSKEYYRKNPELKLKHMPLDMAKNIVDKIVDYGIKTIGLTPQGEFFLYPQWEQLLEYITKSGVNASVCSNGSLLNAETISKLKNFNIKTLAISIDTLRWEVFRKIRSDNKKLFENTINSLFRLESMPFRTQINFVEGLDNCGEFDDIFEFYKKARVGLFFKLREISYEQRISKTSKNSEFPISICEGFGDYIVAVDGNVLACCYMANYPKILSNKAQNLKHTTLEKAINAINDEFIDNRLNGLCYDCPAYRARVIQKESISINGSYAIMKNRVFETYVAIPQKLSCLPDDVLIYMFQNNLVAKMKADKILDY
ncbi:radical SAM protein [Helicobacter sp. MIT 05-5294]|uniref:radical SAM protein n=1 Tax=Helicobacter sp. MIT 05-5294 TaxID=1548150 RepID=UPI000A5AF555|nr:radical SAM protein [Helicobacter sp. MIT 05-5294]TLD88212.1 radical SAM protein [Helicobacter sp. MIT 05-5294]